MRRVDLPEAGNLEAANPGGEQRIIGLGLAIGRGFGGHGLNISAFQASRRRGASDMGSYSANSSLDRWARFDDIARPSNRTDP
jgi:hypothetical protein